jgi:uncharacterized membrane protein YeaQ/YmgE (transglycosylase-associated protein family)
VRIALFLVFGLVCGAVSALVLPGRTPRGWAVSMLIGAAGAMVGGLLGSGLGLNTEGSRLGFLISILGAASWLGIYQLLLRRARSHASHDAAPAHGRRATDLPAEGKR